VQKTARSFSVQSKNKHFLTLPICFRNSKAFFAIFFGVLRTEKEMQRKTNFLSCSIFVRLSFLEKQK